MKTEITFTYSVDSDFENNSSEFKSLLKATIKRTLAKETWWGVEYIGIMIIAVNSELRTTDYFKPKKPKYKRVHILKNPLKGDERLNGYCVIEHQLSEVCYDCIVSLEPYKISHLKNELVELIDKLKFVKAKCSEFDFNEFKLSLLESFEIEVMKYRGQA